MANKNSKGRRLTDPGPSEAFVTRIDQMKKEIQAAWKAIDFERQRLRQREERLAAREKAAGAFRGDLWKSVNAARALSRQVQQENKAYSTIFSMEGCLPLQLLLGSVRAGLDGSDYREDFRRVLARGLRRANQPAEPEYDAAAVAPQEQWPRGNEAADIRGILSELESALTPPFAAGPLAVRLFLTLQSGETGGALAAALTETLKSFDVIPMYYEDESTPAAVRADERNFAPNPNGEPYPALLLRQGDGWLMLASGTRRAIPEDG